MDQKTGSRPPGAQRVPDPTTEGDFCRRFRESDVMDLMDCFNRTRKRVWAEQPGEFFDEAIVDFDRSLKWSHYGSQD